MTPEAEVPLSLAEGSHISETNLSVAYNCEKGELRLHEPVVLVLNGAKNMPGDAHYQSVICLVVFKIN